MLATITPVNPLYSTAARDAFYDQTNVGIKALAREENIVLADLNADFKAAGNLSALFADDVHPNDAGYQVMAQGWFKAITRARSAAASSSPRFGLAPERAVGARGISPDPSGVRLAYHFCRSVRSP